MQGVKHLIKCKCILPHLKNQKEPVFHSFVVFSILNDDETLQEKYAQCNNCGAVHKIVELCKSEITKKEESPSIITEQDITMMIPSELSTALANYNCDIATWEQAHFIYSNEKWGESIVLSKKEEDGVYNGKMLVFVGPLQFKIETFSFSEVI